VFLGWVVTNSNGSAGRAYIKVINGQELDELHDVLIGASPADNDLLAYDSASSLWKNQTAAQAGLAAATHTHVIGDVTGLQTALDNKAPLDPSSVTVANNNTNASFYPLFVSAAGATTLYADITTTPLTYNPNTGEIVARRVKAGGATVYVSIDGPAGSFLMTDGADTSSVSPAFISHNGATGYLMESNVSLEFNAPSHTFSGTGWSYLFPSSSGTNGQVLTTNGAGTLSWQTPAAASGASKAFAVAMAVAL
jgi:hypothetical protein